MKRDEKQQLKSKSIGELQTMVKESREGLRAMMVDLAAGKVKNVGALREVKKNIARMLTIINKENA